MSPLGRVLLAATSLVVLVAPLPGPGGSASASCAAPQLRAFGGDWMPAQPVRVRAGAEIRVEGRYFVTGCDDTGSVRVDAFGCQHVDRSPDAGPTRGIALRVVQGGRSWPLSTASATGAVGTVGWEARLPAELRPGAARLVADVSEPLGLDVQARP